MKNKILSLCIGIFMLVALNGCSKESIQDNKSKEDKIIVYSSFYPMYDFTKNIGKDKIELKTIVPSGVEAHDWEPSAKLITQMKDADVIVYNGLEIEPWVDKLVSAIDNDKLVVVEASKGVNLLKGDEHTEEREVKGKEHPHGEYDPHVWLDPINAIKQSENIKDALIKVDGKNKDFYESNYKEFSNKLKALDNKYKNGLTNLKTNEIVVAHSAFGYLTNRYGLKQIAVSGLSPQEEPSVTKMAEITKIAKEHQLKYIFFETLTNPKLAQVLAKEVGAKTAVLNPIEGLTKEDIKSERDYISIMEENLDTLKRALKE